MNLFRKKEQPKEQYRPETYAMMAELDNTVKIYDAKGGYKSYGIADKKLKSALVVQNTPFDREKKVFTVQCSRDGEDFVNTEWGYKNGHRYGIAENLKFPITLNDAFKLANIIAATNAIAENGDTNFKYWRIGIDWETGFATWFSGDINGYFILDPETSAPKWDKIISHIEL